MTAGKRDCTRRQLLLAAAASAVLAPAVVRAQSASQRRERLVLAGPPAAVAYPLMRIAQSGALADVATRVEFVVWNNPDQLRAMALDGRADFVALPTNVAANLYNRGAALTLLNVAGWGSLWMVSRRADLRTLADFKGQEIAVPFRSDMPDILFQLLVTRQGLDVHRDFRLRYVGTPVEAMQLLVTRQVDHALLTEPAISMALRKARALPMSLVASELHRSVSLQQEWGRVLQREPLIPQAGLAALGSARSDAALLARVQAAYRTALDWCASNPQDCGALAAARVPQLEAEAVAESIRATPQRLKSAAASRADLEHFFSLLLARQPGLVGGKLPDAAFYAAV